MTIAAQPSAHVSPGTPSQVPGWAWLPVPVLLVATLVVWALHPAGVYHSPELLLASNFIFHTLTSLVVLYLIGRNFLAQSLPGTLLLACGIALWCFSSPVSNIVGGQGPNVGITIFNIGIWLAAVCQMAGVMFILRPGARPLRAAPGWLAGGLLLALGGLAAVALAARAGALPVFWSAAEGSTPVRVLVLGSAIAMLALTAALLLAALRASRAAFLHWYAIALLLLAVGLLGVLLMRDFNDAVSWLGRATQWLAGVYLLLAALLGSRAAGLSIVSLPNEAAVARYRDVVALVAPVLATAIRLVFLSGLGTQAPYVVYYPAVMLAALYGGLRAGLLATALSALLAEYLSILPVNALALRTPADWLALTVFIAGCAMIAWITETLHRAQARAHEAETQARLAAERAQAADALRASEAKLRRFFDSDMVGTLFWNWDGQITDANDKFLRMTGYTREDLRLGRLQWSKMTPPEYAPLDAAALDELRATGVDTPYEKEFVRKDGTRLPIIIGAAMLDDSHTEGVAFVLDITARTQAEAALRASEERLQASLRVSRSFTFEWEPATNRVARSQSCADVLGFSDEELRQGAEETFFSRVHPDDRASIDAALAALAPATPDCATEYRFLRPDGRVVIIEEVSRASFAADGTLTRLVGVGTDITARKQAEAALAWAARRNALLSETAARLLQSTDPQGLVQELCQQVLDFLDCQAFFNYLVDPRDERLHLNACAGIPAQAARQIAVLEMGDAVCGCVAQAGARIVVEDILHTDDARTALVRAYGIQAYCCHPLLVQGRTVGTLSFGATARPRFTPDEIEVMRLVADLVAMAMQRLEMEEALRDADRAKDEFLTILSHELQTPVTSILGWAQLALKQGTPELTARALEIVQRNARRQKVMIDELLDVSRLLNRKIELQLTVVDLRAEAGYAVDSLRVEAGERGLTLTCAAGDDPLPVLADPERLQQCLGNLLHNSLKFTPPDGAVTVTCHREDATAVLEVRDTGRGIQPDALTAIFHPFRQVDRDERAGGLGLGLAVTRGLVELHGGAITAASPGEGQGSTFTITLPLAE